MPTAWSVQDEIQTSKGFRFIAWPATFFILVGLGLAIRIWLTLPAFPVLLAKNLPDDAFYYFVIAQKYAAGAGITFDGVGPTNGFHPLWFVIIAPIFRAVPDNFTAVRVVLIIGGLVDVLAAVILALTAEGLQSKSGLLVAALYLFNPRLALEAVNGLETALAMLCLAAFLWAAVRLTRTRRLVDWVLLGFFAGLCVLARTDLGILVAVVMIGILFRRISRSASLNDDPLIYHRVRTILSQIGIAIMTAGLVISPWLIWSYTRLGTLVQSSAVAIPRLVLYRIGLGGALWQELLFPVMNFSLRNLLIFPGIAWITILVPMLMAKFYISRQPQNPQPADTGTNMIRELARPSDPSRSLLIPCLAVVGAVLIVFVHTFVRWYPRGWYFVPLAGTGSFLAGIFAVRMLKKLPSKIIPGIMVFLVLILALQWVKTLSEEMYPGQGDWLRASEWVKSNTAPESVVGAFNAGILAYLSDRTVINMDGAVDWNALSARDNDRLLKYLIDRDGTYLIDRADYIWQSFVPFLGPEAVDLEEVITFDAPDSVYGPLTLYRFKGE